MTAEIPLGARPLEAPTGLLSGSPSPPPAGAERAELAQAAQEFEAYLIKMLLDEMQKTVHGGDLFEGESTGGYRALVDDALARRAAEAGSFGLARQLLEQWENSR